jgi:hypothetical protein
MTPDVQSALQTVLHRGILLAMEVGLGSKYDVGHVALTSAFTP